MTINWPLVVFLFCISIPGIVIAVKRLIFFLLKDNSLELKQKISRLAIFQVFFMVLALTFSGTVLSPKTGLHDTLLLGLLQGTLGFSALIPILLPTVLYSFLGLLVYLVLYYGLIARIIDKKNSEIITNLHNALGIDGVMLYGVVEELIGRWGLMNLALFFALLFTTPSKLLVWSSIFISGLLLAVTQLPVYLAAGCTKNRNFLYSFVLLSIYQSLLFGYLFWQYGIISAILAHMLFYLGWTTFEKKM